MIFLWWKKNRRGLPWRRTRDPYHILVSEVMLQQTQVSRVIPKYTEFIEAFPSIRALAKASPARVLTLWKGMGYNRRALYLKKTAQMIVEVYGGVFPDTQAVLVKLPGLGLYTARAIMVFAFGQNVSMIDTNIRQIITHYFFKGLPQKEKDIQRVADLLVPKGRSWEWHQALMDYGALAMTTKKRDMKVARKQKPFKDSDRYFRGRIIDLLRSEDCEELQLVHRFTSHYGKTDEFVNGIINGLIKDGLIERGPGSLLRLPQ